MPLLIPHGLHKNLETALEKVNFFDHRIIRLISGKVYQVNKLIFPSALSRVLDRYKREPAFGIGIVLSKKWISKVADILRKNSQIDKLPGRKIFITRRKGLRKVENLRELEIMMLKHQFEVIELDSVSLDYQIELFSQASIVIAPTGAALTNMLFCQPGTKVIIFMSNHKTSNYYFWSSLGDIANLDVKIIICERLYNLTNYWSVHDDYKIDPNIMLEEIKKLE